MSKHRNTWNRPRTALAAVVVMAAALVASGCGEDSDSGSSSKDGGGVVKIGAVLPLSGEGTVDQGLASQQAINLAVDELNEDGGIGGNKVEVVFRDDRCDPVTGATAARELLGKEKVDFLVGSICDGVTAAMMEIAEENERIMITPGSTAPAISDGGEHIYRFWFSETQLGKQVADDMQARDVEKVAIIYMNNAWGQAQMEGVTKAVEDAGGEIVLSESVTEQATDFRSTLLKAEAEQPDAYYIGTFPNGLLGFAKQFQARNLDKPVYAHGGLLGSTIALKLADATIEGYRGAFVADPSEEFVEKFQAEYDEAPGITADSAYDAVMAVASAFEDGDEFSTEQARETLDGLEDYEGASGTLTVDENGDTDRPLRMFEVVDGKLVPAEQ